MKKVLLLKLLFITISMSSQTAFNNGFEDGFCAGYKDKCGAYSNCPNAPNAPNPSTYQSSDSYTDGYNTGFKNGMNRGQRDCADKVSDGAYANPKGLDSNPQGSTRSGSFASPKQISNSGTNEAMNDLNKSINNAMAGFAAGISSNISNNSGNIVPLNGVDLDGYKYFVIKKVKSFKTSHVPKIYEKMKKRLERKGFKVIIDSLEYGISYPKDLQNNLNLGIYSLLYIEKSGYWWQSDFRIFTYSNDLIHHRTQRFDNLGIVNESMEPFLAHPYSFDENKVVSQATLDSEKNSINFQKEKEKALKEIKEAKEMVELGVLTDEEYQKMLQEFRKKFLNK